MNNKRICLITFSNNADHQNVVYSMFWALEKDYDVYTIGIRDPKVSIAPRTARNYYSDCPQRPGISKDAFNFSELRKIAQFVKENQVDILYFESQHLWNAFLMVLCPRCKKVVAVHDVIPHDGNRAMDLSNYVTCHQADHIVLRNKKYKQTLIKRYRISGEKITCIDLWRYCPPEDEPVFEKQFLCFGRIRKYKGFDLLKKIIEKTPEMHFRVVGEPDEASRPLVEEIKQLSNAEVTDQEVTDEEMRALFHKADWIVLPYSEATQSGVITDACLLSRPVIAFDVGAISEQIEDGKTGFLIPAGDVDAFSQKIKEVNAFNKEQLASFCHHAFEFGAKKYSAFGAAPKLIEVFRKV